MEDRPTTVDTMPSAEDFMTVCAGFIDRSPTSYHAAAQLEHHLRGSGFAAYEGLGAASPLGFWRREGALAAWRIPPGWSFSDGVRIVASHTDSPALKLKPNPQLAAEGYAQLGVEIYGHPLLDSWLDRELGIAGRVVLANGTVGLVKTGPVARIPRLAPHLDRSLGDGVVLDRQDHLQPLLALDASIDILSLIAGQIDVAPAEILGTDLFCFPTESGRVFGPGHEFFAAYRLDNLSSVFASLIGLVHPAAYGAPLALLIAFDHEEVGSETATGAQGPFLGDVMALLSRTIGIATERLWQGATCISADAGHAVNPNYPGHHDPGHRPRLGLGPLLKINAARRYATDAIGAAWWQRACQAAHVPTQTYVNRNNIPGGSTIGSITAARWGITTVDVGIPLLSMHSARELASTVDIPYLAQALAAYWGGA